MSAVSVRADAIGYLPGVAVLRDVRVDLEPGESVALLGGNGAGKTALLHFIAGALPSQGGHSSVHGHRIASPRDAVRAGVGLVVQDPDDQLLGSTVREDVSLGPRNLGKDGSEVSERVAEALAMVGITSLVDREVESLSFGERKRACLAGVLAMRPRVLLLDEPMAGLDPVAEVAFAETLANLVRAGTTLVVATHAVDLVPRFATRVALLGDGKILFDGAMRDLVEEPELLALARVRKPWPAELWAETGRGAARVPHVPHLPHIPHVPLTLEEAIRWWTPQSS